MHNALTSIMNSAEKPFLREKLQINIFKILIGTIVFLVLVFLIWNEGFFFGI